MLGNCVSYLAQRFVQDKRNLNQSESIFLMELLYLEGNIQTKSTFQLAAVGQFMLLHHPPKQTNKKKTNERTKKKFA